MRKTRKSGKLVNGVGINDADYSVTSTINGIRKLCPFYLAWRGMLQRAYCDNWSKKYPTYKECSVIDEWLVFSNFKSWMETQDWEGRVLDKDILFNGNKIYGHDTCVFVDHYTNTFMLDCCKTRGEYPIGVYFHRGKFVSKIRDNSRKQIHLGRFSTPEEAHSVWYKKKRELAIILASKQSDSRVADALIKRFSTGE